MAHLQYVAIHKNFDAIVEQWSVPNDQRGEPRALYFARVLGQHLQDDCTYKGVKVSKIEPDNILKGWERKMEKESFSHSINHLSQRQRGWEEGNRGGRVYSFYSEY